MIEVFKTLRRKGKHLAAGGFFLYLSLFPIPAGADSREIYNAHEHIESPAELSRYLEAAHKEGIRKTILLGTPDLTFRGRGKAAGLAGYQKHNDAILEMAAANPEELIAFVTIHSVQEGNPALLKKYFSQGARGIKLYGGNQSFHFMALDDPRMTIIYQWAQASGAPILFHVNTGLYRPEFERVLQNFPKLKILCPHFCMATKNPERFRQLMESFPQLFTDITFGEIEIMKAGLLRLSQIQPVFRNLLIQYQDRILFGTDAVLSSSSPYKNEDWIRRIIRTYQDMLSKEEYVFFALPGIRLKGMNLPPQVLEKIYKANFLRFTDEHSLK